MSTSEGALDVDRIVDETLDALHGYTRHQEQVTSLSAPMDVSQISLTVAEGQQVGRGVIEVGNEQMVVKAVDQVGGNVTLQPFGRGVNNTTAAVHSVGDKVSVAPLYPRRRVRDAVFHSLREIFPAVFAPGQTLLTATLVRSNYPLPADCHEVLAVDWRMPGPSQEWKPMRRWRMNRPTGAPEVELLDAFFPMTDNVRVVYIKALPTDLVTDDLASLGYEQSIHDILVLGATSRMLRFTESARLQVASVSSHGRDEVVPAGQLKALATETYALYQRRVSQESDRLLRRYAAQSHFDR